MRPDTPTPEKARLEDMIAKHMAVPGCIAPRQTEGDFIMSAIRAAASANPMTRRKILSDISDVMNCSANELAFLFTEFEMPITTAANYEVMVPDFQRELLTVAE